MTVGLPLSQKAIVMLTSIRYSYVRGRILEGTLPGDPGVGTWMSTHGRIAFGWGLVAESDYPSNVPSAEYFAAIPTEVDRIAKRRRIQKYQRVRNSCEARIIARDLPDYSILVDPSKWLERPEWSVDLKVVFEFTRDFLEAPRGAITYPPPGAPIIGSHTIPIVGVSESQRSVLVTNPRWPGWGDKGQGLMPFEFFDRFMIEAGLFDYTRPQLPDGDRLARISWERPDPLGGVLHGVEVYDPRADERLGWCLAVRRVTGNAGMATSWWK
jgi:hypothetical protein